MAFSAGLSAGVYGGALPLTPISSSLIDAALGTLADAVRVASLHAALDADAAGRAAHGEGDACDVRSGVLSAQRAEFRAILSRHIDVPGDLSRRQERCWLPGWSGHNHYKQMLPTQCAAPRTLPTSFSLPLARERARRCACEVEVYVATDSPAAAETARRWGARHADVLRVLVRDAKTTWAANANSRPQLAKLVS